MENVNDTSNGKENTDERRCMSGDKFVYIVCLRCATVVGTLNTGKQKDGTVIASYKDVHCPICMSCAPKEIKVLADGTVEGFSVIEIEQQRRKLIGIDV